MSDEINSRKSIDSSKMNDFKFDLPHLNNTFNFHDIGLISNPTYALIEKQEEANALLGRIVENTSVLKELVEINRKTQLNTEELTYVMRAIYKVAKAKDKEESNAFFTQALKAINDSGEAVSNIANLTSLLMGIYSTVNTLF
ncbi:hypothetical protein C8U37_101205 [Trichococcus patagoniensis]|uniref:Uncharacterized protein n=1 Tax=Trichococcus patagoniensis TaxID=382641 RepID=A0A2T5IRB8_9LACT|nr:hypothetical protein [Trichococcus patagoniensis]PTQ86364.1 hypothetical protein C8U37_101205 [Trichococcus patagoniensis]